MDNNSEVYLRNDFAIVYQGKLMEAKDLIQKAKSIGLNVATIEEEVEKIEKTLVENVAANYNEEYNKSYTESAQSFSHDAFSNIYQKATKSLDEIIRALNIKCDDYYKIGQAIIIIENSIKNEKIDINNVIDTTISTLQEMRKSKTIDYEVERDIVTRLYRIIYEIMKIELVYTKERRILDTIMDDETDSMFIVELIEEDLKNVNDDDANDRANMLQSKGMNPRLLLDVELIRLVAILKSSTMLEEIKDTYTLNKEQLEKIDKELSEIQKKYNRTETYYENEKEKYSELKRKTRKAGFRAIFNAVAFAFVLTGGYKLADKYGQSKEFYTNTSTYTTETGETTLEKGYTKGDDNSVIIIEKTPWSSPGFFREGEHERTIYKYSVPEEYIDSYNDPKEFLTENLRGIIETSSTETETSKEIPEDYGYGQNQYTVIKQTKDLDNFNYTRDYKLFAIILGGTILGVLIVELIYLKIIDDNKFSILRKRKKYSAQRKEDLKTDLASISEQIESLKKDSEYLGNEIESQEKLIEEATNENNLSGKEYIKRKINLNEN